MDRFRVDYKAMDHRGTVATEGQVTVAVKDSTQFMLKSSAAAVTADQWARNNDPFYAGSPNKVLTTEALT